MRRPGFERFSDHVYTLNMKLKIGIAGITGRMGKLLAEEVLVAGATLTGGTGRQDSSATLFTNIYALAQASDLVIDFTTASLVSPHAAAMAASGKPWVLGTTGFDGEAQAAITTAATQIPIIAAPNYSPGVNLIFALAERLAAALPAATYDAEILEMHHSQKIDAPSGTALGLGHAIAAGRNVALADVMVSGRHGHTGPRRDGDIGFATLRGGQIPGSHSAIFTTGAEQITLTHHAFDRRIFATGAVRAALWLADKPPGLCSMKDVLGI